MSEPILLRITDRYMAEGYLELLESQYKDQGFLEDAKWLRKEMERARLGTVGRGRRERTVSGERGLLETPAREHDERIRALSRALRLAHKDGRPWGELEPIKQAAGLYLQILGAPTVYWCSTHNTVGRCRAKDHRSCEYFPKKLVDPPLA